MDKLSREIQSQTTAGLKNKLEDIFEGDTKVPSQFKSVFDNNFQLFGKHCMYM